MSNAILELRSDNGGLSVLLVHGATAVSVWDAWADDGQALIDFMQPGDVEQWHTHFRDESPAAHGAVIARSSLHGVIVKDPEGFSEVIAQLKTMMSEEIHHWATALKDQSLIDFMEDGGAVAATLPSVHDWVALHTETKARTNQRAGGIRPWAIEK